jgi:surfactin synthase thioesterase subunit
MDALVSSIADGAAFEAPYALFGHSLGAVVAYEVARALAARDRPAPGRLFVSGHAAPSLPRVLPAIGGLPDEPFMEEVQRRHGGLPPEALDDPDIKGALVSALRADYAIVETYDPEPRPPLTEPISVFAGTEDLLSDADLNRWQDHTTAPLVVRRFPGGHFYLRERVAPALREIARTARG